MSASEPRRRPRPSDRFAGAVHALDLPTATAALRAEPRSGLNRHRQITLVHHGPVRLVLFAFDRGGSLPQHDAPGWITIHMLRGSLRVRTPTAHHALREGQILALAPGVPYEVDATEEADMLLGVYPESPLGSEAPAEG